MNEVPEVYSGPFRRRHRDMQKTLMIVANVDVYAKTPTGIAKTTGTGRMTILPQESMHTEPPDPDYMEQHKGPFWRATHD